MSAKEPSQILKDAKMLLCKMKKYKRIIPRKLTPAEQVDFRATFQTLYKKADTVNSDASLLVLAQTIVAEVEAHSALSNAFLGNQKVRTQRALSPADFEQSGESLAESDEERRAIINTMKTQIEVIINVLLPETGKQEKTTEKSQNV